VDLKKKNPFLKIELWKRTLLILFIVQLFTAVGFSIIFPFLPLFIEDLGSIYDLDIELLAGLVFSGQAFTMMIASPIWGNLADRFGKKIMIQRAQFGGAILLTMMAFVQNAEQLVLLRTIQGFITGTVSANNALIASVTPRKHVGYAMGMLQVGLGSGLAFGPMIGGFLADSFGYSSAFFVTGALLLISGFMVTFWIHEEPMDRSIRQKNTVSLMSQIKVIFKLSGVSPTLLLRFFSQLSRMLIIPFLPIFIAGIITDSSNENSFIGLVIGVASGATTLSAIYLGKLGDRIGYRKVLFVSLIAAGILYFPTSYVTEGWQILVLQALVGVAMGGIIPMISALLAKYTDPGEEGVVYGIDTSINAAGRAVAPMIGGLIIAISSINSIFTVIGILLLFSAFLSKTILPDKKPEVLTE
jgi:DHA1 family multidrug resistance protein-like MFS transporter